MVIQIRIRGIGSRPVRSTTEMIVVRTTMCFCTQYMSTYDACQVLKRAVKHAKQKHTLVVSFASGVGQALQGHNCKQPCQQRKSQILLKSATADFHDR